MDDFAYLATQFPEIPFIVIGGSAEIFSAAGISIPKNLQIIESLKQDELKEYYYSSKVFCLFSLTEGMPNVLCEAMLCGCIPVGSAVNFIPEIIGNNGFIVRRKNGELLTEALSKALAENPQMGNLASESIKKRFSIETREKELVSLLHTIIPKKNE